MAHHIEAAVLVLNLELHLAALDQLRKGAVAPPHSVDANRSGSSATSKKLTQPAHEDLEKAVFKWFVQTRAKEIPLSGDVVHQNALDYACLLGINDFKASASETSGADEDEVYESPSDDYADAWAALRETGDVPADVTSRTTLVPTRVVVREELTDEDILKVSAQRIVLRRRTKKLPHKLSPHPLHWK
ncbi:hypothetical protein HPB48_007849 [Haemaphysalis longicornis]|uniref:HTH CENPB-type domain-containing protein n=1 Tax=Haemaphysalis longicornis TaxID=44386 RepID=A0A9J6GK65_HAELO|nr:hypothetical protein HPB48_007849 [Haemaphysalis longicornis]